MYQQSLLCLIGLYLFALSVVTVAAAPPTADSLGIIPQPAKLSVPADRAGEFVISSTTVVNAVGPAAIEARKLVDALAPAMGYRLNIMEAQDSAQKGIVLEIDPKLESLGKEGYRLAVADRITISALDPAGLFYGTRTLLQLLPPAIFRQAQVKDVRWAVPQVVIEDRPRFGHRGMLLDPARHFLPKSFILRFIDEMALHKFNRLQLHLTDDQGWRIEIRKYPKLTEVGAWRDETVGLDPRINPPKGDGRRHGGFFTQADIREMVAYAADRYITIVPEIEMPGHCRAAIASYPELGCHPDQPIKVDTGWGVSPHILCPTDRTVAFMQDVLTEVLELFPSKFIHIGGDEAIKDQWKASPVVQARIKELNLKDEAEMQSWFTRQMDRFLADHGRRLVGWDEILEGGLAPGAVVMSWRGVAGGIAAAKADHDVIMAPTSHTYLDFRQGPPETEWNPVGTLLSIDMVYQFEPIPPELSADQARHILGGQGQLWGERIPDPRHCEYMAFPRAAALAEVLWSPVGQRNYASFSNRLRTNVKRLDVLDVNYRKLDGK